MGGSVECVYISVVIDPISKSIVERSINGRIRNRKDENVLPKKKRSGRCRGYQEFIASGFLYKEQAVGGRGQPKTYSIGLNASSRPGWKGSRARSQIYG
jgi:hypothetical protein